jgi:N-methylhydantoinase B/oxoprolinase/acetone carboxylase alpha subunit
MTWRRTKHQEEDDDDLETDETSSVEIKGGGGVGVQLSRVNRRRKNDEKLIGASLHWMMTPSYHTTRHAT